MLVDVRHWGFESQWGGKLSFLQEVRAVRIFLKLLVICRWVFGKYWKNKFSYFTKRLMTSKIDLSVRPCCPCFLKSHFWPCKDTPSLSWDKDTSCLVRKLQVRVQLWPSSSMTARSGCCRILRMTVSHLCRSLHPSGQNADVGKWEVKKKCHISFNRKLANFVTSIFFFRSIF